MSGCHAPSCSKPTQTMLCRDCLTDLVQALRAIAYGEADRRNGDGRDADDVQRQGLYEDLVDSCYHLTKLGPSSMGVRAHTDTELWPNMRAIRLRDTARNTITTWARDFHETNPHLTLPATVPAAAAWMAGLPGLLAMHPAAGDMCADILPLPKRIHRVVERVPGTYLGQCGAIRITPEEVTVCERDIFAKPDDHDLMPTEVECAGCKTTWLTEARRETMLRAVEDQLATATWISRALPGWLDEPITASMIRGYAHRGRLAKRPPDPHDPRKDPLYRIGDVIALVIADARAQAEREQRKDKRKAKAS